MKLFALDLDGTLLNSNCEISEENIKALKFAKQRGIEIVIASGRAHFDIMNIFKDSGLSPWMISANGAMIHDPDGTLFDAIPLEKNQAFAALEWLEQGHYYYEVFSNHAIYTPQKGRQILEIEIDRIKSANPEIDLFTLKNSIEKQFSQFGFVHIQSYSDLLPTDIDIFNILAFSFDEEKLAKGWKYFSQQRDMTLVSSAEHNFELEHLDASKGLALEKLAKRLQIELSACAAAGDSYNDISMITKAGQGVAMGNAHKDIKAAADWTTLTNDANGVAYFIYSTLGVKYGSAVPK
ncbi:HAD family phosphatase [Bacillaceae bacterium Marseille-Q3522]|nr:HAD family phosphatase [Bacillaceae bacterium Marseille-Q3522]